MSGSGYNRTGDRFTERRVVTIGGGTGTFALLSHPKKDPFILSAIVTMWDSGGSSRRLMDEFDIVSTTGKGTEITMKKWRRKA